MSNDKQIKTRIINKHDLEANWNAATFIPKQGELIIYDVEVDADGNTLALPQDRTVPYTYERLKIGDGIHIVKDLQFTNEAALEGYALIGSESDDDRELTIYGVRDFATRAAEEVVGDANDAENDNTVYGAKAYAAKIVEEAEIALIGRQTDPDNADTIYGAKNFAVEYTNSKTQTATDDEVLALLSQKQIIEPMSDASGATYTDHDDKILVI